MEVGFIGGAVLGAALLIAAAAARMRHAHWRDYAFGPRARRLADCYEQASIMLLSSALGALVSTMALGLVLANAAARGAAGC